MSNQQTVNRWQWAFAILFGLAAGIIISLSFELIDVRAEKKHDKWIASLDSRNCRETTRLWRGMYRGAIQAVGELQRQLHTHGDSVDVMGWLADLIWRLPIDDSIWKRKAGGVNLLPALSDTNWDSMMWHFWNDTVDFKRAGYFLPDSQLDSSVGIVY